MAMMAISQSFALVVHNANDWEIAIIAIAVTYPSMLYYTYTQMQRANQLRERAQMMRGMTELAGSAMVRAPISTLVTVTPWKKLIGRSPLMKNPAQGGVQGVMSDWSQAGGSGLAFRSGNAAAIGQSRRTAR